LLRFATFALVAASAPRALADTQSSASFGLVATIDGGGGRSSSSSHVVTSCIGSEIAGTQTSTSFRIDSGCGATALAVVKPSAQGGGGTATPVPALGEVGLAILAALLIVVAARRFLRRG